ncbi:MAG: hypothetical protein SX243_14150 [Acidobacteriota bacterium]|nr:hypothetical protein [Acidobacteriota bacterium]
MPDEKSPESPPSGEVPADPREVGAAASPPVEGPGGSPTAAKPSEAPSTAGQAPTEGAYGKSSVPLGETKPCILCKKPIPKDARVCTHCDRRQSRWLRHLPTLQSLATLLLAGIAVVTFAYSTYDRLDKRIKVTEGESWTRAGTIHRAVFFSNPLKQEGYLVRATLFFEDGKGKVHEFPLLATEQEIDIWKLPGEEQKRIEFAFEAEKHPEIPKDTPLTATRLEIALVNGASKVQTKTVFVGTRQEVQF